MIEPAPFDRDALLEELNAEAKGVVIPRNFDPFAGGTQNVDLPPEPDEDEQPELHRFWTDMFSQPLVFESGDFEYETEVNNQSYGPAAQQPRQQSSLNWSGASITPRDGRMFTEVFATFVVPQVIVPTGADATKEYKSSCWVGLDGQRAYADSTLPQLGTEQVINKGGLPTGPQYSVWIQWWPLPVITIPSLTVTFGQRVFCWMTALSFTRVRCMIKIAAGPGPLHRFYLNSPTINYDRPPLMLGHQAQITGGTAQWITEAPTSEFTGKIFPLPNYTQVDFEQCYAISRPIKPGPGGPVFRVDPLIGPTRTFMYRVVGGDGRRVTISTAKRTAIDVVTTTYVG